MLAKRFVEDTKIDALACSFGTAHGIYKETPKLDFERISLIHNNLELNHYIRGEDKDYLISWDNATFDSPVLDLVHLYKKEFFNVEFSSLFKIYNNFILNTKTFSFIASSNF